MNNCDSIDKDGLQTALKYFNSSTLTMRLGGIAQMNNYITMYNDLTNNPNSNGENLSEQMSQWILENKLLENIFGPNLHVEVIKQSHYVLSAISPKITTEHIDIIWSSAQIKHYERFVYEVLCTLVKNLNFKTVLYLYKLLWTIKPSHHSEQTLNLASQITKYIWSHCGVQPDIQPASHYGAGDKEMTGEDSNFKGSHTVFPYLRDPPSKENSSSASSVEVSEDEEDEEDFEMDMGSSRICIDKGPLSKINSDESSGSTSESDIDELSDLPKEKPSYKLPRNFHRKPKMDSPTHISGDEYKPNTSMSSFPKVPVNESQDETKFQKEKVKSPKNTPNNLGEENSFNEIEPFEMYECGDEIKNCYNYTKSLAARRIAEAKKVAPLPTPPTECITDELRIADVTKPGQTLLWDLIHDDMLNQLTEELATAADRIFWNTICCASNRQIRIMFINAALENLAKNNSVITMFRLLQKLFSSFFPYQDGRMTRKLIFDADKQQSMLKSFFNNLTLYMSCCKNDSPEYDSLKSKFCTQKEEIQIRLNFLSYIFMYAGPSHENLSFSQEHVNILWDVFTTCNYPEIADEFFDWLLNQGKSNGINLDIIKYILVEKMPLLRPESYSLTSLDLLQHLHGFFFSKNCIDASTVKDVINLVWAVAFKNPDTEVSMAAIRHLNQHYISLLNSTNKFDKEEEFIQKCMLNLKDASVLLPINCDKSLVLIERAVIMLKTHLEVFYNRYSYYFRKLKLASDVDLYCHRARERLDNTLNFYIISPYSSDKKLIEMSSTDCVGELRAEVQTWWQSILESSSFDKDATVPEALICLVHQQTEQEIPFEYDEKRIGDVFKDSHVNQISFHTCKNPLSKSCDLFTLSSSSEFFDSFKLQNSHKLLLEPHNFELLFILVQQLDMINISNLKARILSRNIWEIVQILPASTDILDRFDLLSQLYSESLSSEDDLNDHAETPQAFKHIFERIFPSNSNQKLIYSCHIVDNLRKAGKNGWPGVFTKTGGLQFLYNLFIVNVETTKYKHEWTEWKQDCVSTLLQTIYHFATSSYREFESLRYDCDKMSERESSSMGYNSDGSRKNKRTRKNSLEKNILLFNSNFIALIDDQERLMNVLFSILKFITQNSKLKLFYQTTISSRAQVVIFNLSFFTSWCYTDSTALDIFYQNTFSKVIIKKLILEDSDPQVRKEVSLAFIRLCLGSTSEGRNLRGIIPKFLSLLLSFLEEASTVNINIITANANRSAEEKDFTGPGCKDYFNLVCRLIEPFVSQSFIQTNNSEIDIDNLCQLVANSIIKRESYELCKNTIEDEGLRGLVILLGVLVKHNPKFKHRPECREFIMQIFNSLFALPTHTQRALPKCRSSHTRSAMFELLIELVKGNEDNFTLLTDKLIDQHRHEVIGRSSAYPWEYWPQEESRSECGFVGLSNLGATCYLASCMQHLFMLTDVRSCILTTHLPSVIKHESILRELQKMFIFLQESERRSYNPKSFCKVYTMDHQPLNICEQKDMTEFFTDVISKLEEMTIDLKDMMKRNFSGLQSNNVVSLDCPHISQTTEEFYTLRCQVSDMRDLYESLNELTVKDTLEGDNMYNCSKCGKKVRAEKRACIKKLPKILCFNTMRYTFNMITMTKEKVNTHFSFPLTLDMAPYLEKNLLVITDKHDGEVKIEDDEEDSKSTKYELIGVTVHTGTADGGHYYSFIQDRDPHSVTRDRWFFFNDAEVRPFDKGLLAAECFGGETTSKQYDQTNDKFFDCSIEKTNSAYMLFYERIDDDDDKKVALSKKEADCSNKKEEGLTIKKGEDSIIKTDHEEPLEEISQSLMDWIWEDNISFLRDQFIFDHHYFDFIWQVCSQVPQTLPNSLAPKTTLISTRLATLFVLETLIHAKEKPTLAQWIELLTKQFNNSQNACEWLIDHMSQNDWWLVQILLKCSNQMVRQLFVRLLIHVITKTKPNPIHSLYLHPLMPGNLIKQNSLSERYATVTRFISRFISLIDIERMNTKPCIKNLTEYFHFLNEFAKQGEEECKYLISIEAISTIINFYLNYGKIQNEFLDNFSDNEDDDFDERPSLFGPLMEDKFPKMISLDKMITLIVYLLDSAQRFSSDSIGLTPRDFDSLISGRSFLFIQQQIRDNINLRQTFNLIVELRKLDESLAPLIVNMLFSSITRVNENITPFFKILSFIAENISLFSYFAKMILPQIWDCCHHSPMHTLEWLVQHVPRNKLLHDHVLSTLDFWVVDYLMDHGNIRVRSSAAQLLISLVPSQDNAFRHNYRPYRAYPYICKEILLSSESMAIIEKIYSYLVNLVKKLKNHSLSQAFGLQKLTNYFYVLSYFFVYSKQRKMFYNHFHDFWNFFSSKLSEPTHAIHQNKQAFLMFLYLVCQECPECTHTIAQTPSIYRKLAFNYILADHEDQDIILFNKNTLPYYYGLLKLCCRISPPFTRFLADHQNIQWAYQNITPFPNHYPLAVKELFELMKLFENVREESTEEEKKAMSIFKKDKG